MSERESTGLDVSGKAIGIRITHRGFGKDWRYPITSRYRERYE